LLCDLVNAKPLLVIELDDWRHEKWGSTKEKDRMKERLFEYARLPFLRKKISEYYDKTKLAQEIEDKMLK
jgi:hypothetical protein